MKNKIVDKKDKEKIELVITHCEMFLYGFHQPSFLLSDFTPTRERIIADLYNIFTGMHLISTMFLLDKENNPMGGFCYRILGPLGLGHLLKPIKKIMDTPLDKTTFGNYIRRSRAKLATHGDLSFSSLRFEEQEITFDNKKILKFQKLMERLDEEVESLKNKLEEYIK